MRIKVVTIVPLFIILFMLATLAQKNESEEARLVKYLSKLFNADKKSVVIEGGLKNSSLIKGAKEGTVTVGRQRANIYLIDQKLIIGLLHDLELDPYKENMKKMSLAGRPSHGSGPVILVEYSDFQ